MILMIQWKTVKSEKGKAKDPNGACFRDQNPRDSRLGRDLVHFFSIPKGEVSSISWCRNKCNKENYKFAGLQNHSECYCGNDYGKYGAAPMEECSRNCLDSGLLLICCKKSE